SIDIDNEGSHSSFTIAAAEPAPAFFRSPYEPRTAPAPVAFDAAAPAALEVKKAPTGHLLVKPRIAGKDAGWFIFDSGAGNSVVNSPNPQNPHTQHLSD